MLSVYCDPQTIAFEYEKRLAERLAVFSLQLYPQKTRVMEFCRFAESNARKLGGALLLDEP